MDSMKAEIEKLNDVVRYYLIINTNLRKNLRFISLKLYFFVIIDQ